MKLAQVLTAALVAAVACAPNDAVPSADAGDDGGVDGGADPVDAGPRFHSTPVTDYTPVAMHGWVVRFANDLDAGGVLPVYGRDAGISVFDLVSQELQAISQAVPAPALGRIRQVDIYVTAADTACSGACYHGGGEWLAANGYDARKAKSIEFTNSANFVYYSNSQPWAVLHELAHAYHDHVLGTQDTDISDAYDEVVDSGVLKQVKFFDGRRTVYATHYALNNPAEFFAEFTESYFGRNDFAPFDRTELHAKLPKVERLIAVKWGDDAGSPDGG